MYYLIVFYLFSLGSPSPVYYDYAVQRSAFFFDFSPQSQTVISGDNVMLSCNVSVMDDYRMTIHWRYNSYNIDGDSDNKYIDVHKQFGKLSSTLHIKHASMANEGYYQCLALDGIDTLDNSALITISYAAELDVIDNSYSDFDVIHSKERFGHYIVLSCKESRLPYKVLWQKDGSNMSSYDGAILSNGSLLIYDLTKSDEGLYQCTFWMNGYLVLHGTLLHNLTISDNVKDIEDWAVIIDPDSIVIAEQENVSMTCYTVGLNSNGSHQIIWSRDGDNVSENSLYGSYGNLLISTEYMNPGKYVYKCTVLTQDEKYKRDSTLQLIIQSTPNASHFQEMFTPELETRISIDFPFSSGSNISFIWYKNGIDITYASNSSTGKLEYAVGVNESATGIYQCFILNDVGRDYSITRVLSRGYANPPQRFTCRAMDSNRSANSLPRAILTWDPPTLSTIPIEQYIVKYTDQDNKDMCFYTNNTYFEINLMRDRLFVNFEVAVFSNDSLLIGAKSTCQIVDTLERRVAQSNVRELDVVCPTSDLPGVVKWENPRLNRDLNLEEYQINCTCIHYDNETSCGHLMESSRNLSITFDVDSQPSSSLCTIRGSYNFRGYETPLIIPPVICLVPPQTLQVNSPSQTYIQEVSQTNLMDGRNTTSSGGSLTSEINSPSQTYIQEVSQTNLMDGRNTTSSGGSLTSEIAGTDRRKSLIHIVVLTIPSLLAILFLGMILVYIKRKKYHKQKTRHITTEMLSEMRETKELDCDVRIISEDFDDTKSNITIVEHMGHIPDHVLRSRKEDHQIYSEIDTNFMKYSIDLYSSAEYLNGRCLDSSD